MDILKFNKRLDATEEKISVPEEITKENRKKYTEKKMSEKKWKTFSDLWDKIKWSNVYEMEALEKGRQKIYLKK